MAKTLRCRWLAPLAVFGIAGASQAQQFIDNTTDIPQGNPANNSLSENIDFADVDLDGDMDAAFADGGDNDQDQNRLWRNRGPGNIGVFIDVTNSTFPAILSQSRDIEFVDFDNDGDADIYSSNTSQLLNQTNRFWRNTGVGDGVYVDETAMRWVNLGVNNASTRSSVPASAVLGSGGFIDWSCDCDFGDIDNDGDLDLVHSSYGGAFGGQVPTRIFLNDGAGMFEEFNPSGFQLTGTNIANNNPGLWCEGLQQNNTSNTTGVRCDIATSTLDIDLGDIDGDLDLDILHGNREEPPRMFRNLLEENGGGVLDLGFQDITNLAFPPGWGPGNGHYEQEMADMDNDGDLDIYGLNWNQSGFNFTDITLRNTGNGIFDDYTNLGGSGNDDNEGDFIDYDNDGDMDLFVANFSGQDRLYRNNHNGGTGFSYTNVTAGNVPASTFIALDADIADVDQDGDWDIFVSNDNGARNFYYENTLDPAVANDGHAPSLYRLEQADDRPAGPDPTVVRIQVYDNAPYYAVWYYDVVLRVSVDGGPFVESDMLSSGGQIFRGTIDGMITGTVCYEVVATDNYGNSTTSNQLCYASGVAGAPMTYCTPKLSSAFCFTLIGATSASAPTSGDADFSVTAIGAQGFKNGLLFAGLSGPAALPFSGGTLCVQPPTKRGPITNSGGTGVNNCDGSFSTVVNDGSVIPFGLDAGSGNTAWYQYWYRDPQNGAGNLGTALSDGIQVNFN